jgi:type IV pilus assembly protein PilE
MHNLDFALHSPHRPEDGFTLIEVMVTVAIVAILASIAIPSYTAYITRAKLTEAVNNLADTRIKMEQWYQDNRNYGTTGTTCGMAMPATAATNNFAITCATIAPYLTYTLSAKSLASRGLGAADDYTYTIDQTNAKSTTKFKGAASTKTCWLNSGSEC